MNRERKFNIHASSIGGLLKCSVKNQGSESPPQPLSLHPSHMIRILSGVDQVVIILYSYFIGQVMISARIVQQICQTKLSRVH